MPKDNFSEENIEQTMDKVSVSKVTGSPKSISTEQTIQPRKKAIKRLVSPAKDTAYIGKDRPKKNSSKAVSSISANDESTLVNGEAKIG